jgi:hypothetical protein
MLGCTFFDWCSGPPCTWNVNCYTSETDPAYQNLIMSFCEDTARVNHSARLECGKS